MANNKDFVVKNGLTVGTDATIGSTLYVSTVDTTDSSAITVVPSTTFNSDVTVENDLRVRNAIENTNGNTILPAVLGNADQVLTVESDGLSACWKSISDVFGGGIDNVVEDTTPQLGGDLEVNGNNIIFNDNEKALFGESSDLQIYHDGSNSYISDQGTGSLHLLAQNFRLKNSSNNEVMMQAIVNGAVSLYYDGSSKLATTNTGVDVTGELRVSTIDTDDSSAITVIPAATFNSDVTVENTLYSTAAIIDNLGVSDALYVDLIRPRTESGLNKISIYGEVTFDDVINVNTIDTVDSSTITFVPHVEFSTDVNAQNNLIVNNQVIATRFKGDGSELTNIQTSLYNLTDTRVDTQATNTLLKYNGTKYIPTILTENSSGDVTANSKVKINYSSTTEPALSIESTDGTSDASPEVELYKNSTSSDGHYLGQIKFAGENDIGNKVNYAKITGKILDNTNSTEDGILEFAFQKAGSLNISARFRSDSLQLINGTNLVVNGTTTLEDTVTVNSNIVITGTVDGRDVATDGAKLDTIESNATADQTAAEILAALITVDGAGTSLDADLLDGQQGSHYLDGSNFTGTLPNDYVTLGTMTTGNYLLDVSGTTNEIEITHTPGEGSTATIGLPDDVTIGNNLTVTTSLFTPIIDTTDSSGITVVPSVTFNSDVTVENDLRVRNDIENASGSTLLPATLGTTNQVLTVNAAGNAEWSTISTGGLGNVVEDTTPQLGGDLDLNSQDITGTGNISVTGNVTVDGILLAPTIDTTDSSNITVIPGATFNSDLSVENNVTVTNSVTASTYYGDGSNLTGINVTTTFVDLTDTDVASQATDTLVKYNGTNYVATSTSEDSSGNVTIAGQLNVSTIDTTDSSAISVTPAATFNSDVTVENSLLVNNDVYVGHHIDFDTTAHGHNHTYQEGRIWYDSVHKTFNYYSDVPNVVHEIGLEQHIRVYNNSGSTITKGQPLYFTGNYENGHVVPTVGLANATSASKYDAQGLAAADIANGEYGFCQLSGQLFELDTSGLTAGQHFYVGLTDGALQNASPSYPNYPVLLGWVVKSHATDGVVNIHLEQHTMDTFRVVNDAHFGNDVVVDGDLTVNGTQTITSQANISAGSAFIYLNGGDTIGEANTTFTGSGLDDAYFSGHYNGTGTTNYYVRIDSTGTPDTFEWSKDNFSSTEATGVAITGSDQTLDQGISINFGATTGHTTNDVWSGTAAPTNVDTGFFSNRNTGATGVGYTHAGLFFDITDEKWKLVEEYDPTPTGTIDTGHASYNEATLSLDTLEAATGTFSTAVTVGGNNVLTTASQIALGTNTTGNYVATITGTANEVEVSGSGSETAAVTVGLPDDVTIGNELTVTTALFTPTIDTTDSSAITVIPSATFNSDVTIENDLRVRNDIENTSGETILPSTLGTAGKVLTVNSAGDGVEWAASSSTSGFTEEFPTVTNGSANVTMGGSYALDQLIVYLNGVKLRQTSEYTVSGTTLTFSENLVTGDIVNLIVYTNAVNITGVTSLTGTANEVEVSASTGAVTVGLPNDVTIGNDLTVTNRVGIGTSTPAQELDVNGNIAISGVRMLGFGPGDDASNIAIGNNTLKFNQVNGTAGKNNIAIGENALRDNTSSGTYTGTNEGSQNVAIGANALVNNESGKFNTGIGAATLQNNLTGQHNTVIGYVAGQNLTGNRSTVIGASAATTASMSGNENTLIGYDSQPSSNTASDEITLGDTSAKSFRIPGSNFYINGGTEGTTGGRVGIGTSSPAAALDVNGNVVVSGQLEVSTIDTTDSSAITVVPAATFNSDVTVENDLSVNGNVVVSGQLEVSTIDTTDSSALSFTPAVTFNSDVTIENDLSVNGTVNDRDIATDGAKLDTVDPNAINIGKAVAMAIVFG